MKLLLLDLDETLIHCSHEFDLKDCQHKIKATNRANKLVTVGLKIRPFA